METRFTVTVKFEPKDIESDEPPETVVAAKSPARE
jgi:hypothetical protein